MRLRTFRIRSFIAFALIALASFGGDAVAQSSRATRHRLPLKSICGNPQVQCKTSITFAPHDLPFRVPKDAVIYDTELFYAIILRSIGQSEDDCDVFVPEHERLAAQAMFPRNKVFASRCPNPGEADGMLFYTNISSKHRIMALYAGTTLVEAKRLLDSVKATGKFPGANIRRMRTGFNGT